MSTDYDALATQLSDPATTVTSAGEVKTGAAAAAAGSAFLLREYGSPDAVAEAMGINAGRPRVGNGRKGPSPTVRARISDADYAAFTALEARTGLSQSELVRRAVHEMLLRDQARHESA